MQRDEVIGDDGEVIGAVLGNETMSLGDPPASLLRGEPDGDSRDLISELGRQCRRS